MLFRDNEATFKLLWASIIYNNKTQKTMKNVVRLSRMITLAFVLTFATSITFASAIKDKAVEKARAAVVKADSDDWQTLTKSAKVLMKKNAHLEEALTWIEKSISIDKNVQNLELRGDYYVKFGNNREAMISYVEAIKVGKLANFNFNSRYLEEKISRAR